MSSDTTSPAQFWEDRYAGADKVWSGRVNQVVADVAGELPPGRALDLGCGEGGDAVWLARQGWAVTGVDLSPTAVARGRAAAAAACIPPDRLELLAADLATWTTERRYDLVTASFLQSWPVEIPRPDILRRAASFVAPGGRLLVLAHAAAPSWAPPEMVDGYPFPSPEGDLAALALGDAWTVLAAETRERATTSPDGEPATLLDSVVLVRRGR
ncbi:class I SAM-dependent methyltransferase [Myceligenerans pegani]|uniref:Methyltransferase domain-containing protein n=1 Tax=Myceligenerans pegani TaxID=2776917 RepID=A0ABR9N242_9MICO|nr:methyltransferase domain-containing protein [Myceligenerans sp. TRM 65318]MBE1877726.1 methyltransferase domain-containing protein [Myceligenerans sp. TRM 65318]MBE3019997.1 methyltransferase domain-containing protein [Myceligenerans sp. TRM 65318]